MRTKAKPKTTESRPAKRGKSTTNADPIYAAIEAHRKAWARFEAAVEAESKLESKLWKEGKKHVTSPAAFVRLGLGYTDVSEEGIAKHVKSSCASFVSKNLQDQDLHLDRAN